LVPTRASFRRTQINRFWHGLRITEWNLGKLRYVEVRKMAVATHGLFSLLSSSFKMFSFSVWIFSCRNCSYARCVSAFLLLAEMLIHMLRKECLTRTPQTIIGSRNAVNKCLTVILFYIHTHRLHFGHMNAFLILTSVHDEDKVLPNIFVY